MSSHVTIQYIYTQYSELTELRLGHLCKRCVARLPAVDRSVARLAREYVMMVRHVTQPWNSTRRILVYLPRERSYLQRWKVTFNISRSTVRLEEYCANQYKRSREAQPIPPSILEVGCVGPWQAAVPQRQATASVPSPKWPRSSAQSLLTRRLDCCGSSRTSATRHW